MNPFIQAIETAFTDLKNFIENDAKTAISFLLSFFKEAITEEEAALFPAFKTQAVQIFNDAVMTAGLSVEARVALVVTEASVDLAQDVAIARQALYSSWAWAIAHQQGLTNGNQGNMPSGNSSGT